MDEAQVKHIRRGLRALSLEEAQALYTYCEEQPESIEELAELADFSIHSMPNYMRSIYRAFAIKGIDDITPEICELFKEEVPERPTDHNWPPTGDETVVDAPPPDVAQADTVIESPTEQPEVDSDESVDERIAPTLPLLQRIWRERIGDVPLWAVGLLVATAVVVIWLIAGGFGADEDGPPTVTASSQSVNVAESDRPPAVGDPPTNTPSATPSPSHTPTPTITPSPTPSHTPTSTPTPSNTPTPSTTPTSTVTPTRTPTSTPAPIPSFFDDMADDLDHDFWDVFGSYEIVGGQLQAVSDLVLIGGDESWTDYEVEVAVVTARSGETRGNYLCMRCWDDYKVAAAFASTTRTYLYVYENREWRQTSSYSANANNKIVRGRVEGNVIEFWIGEERVDPYLTDASSGRVEIRLRDGSSISSISIEPLP